VISIVWSLLLGLLQLCKPFSSADLPTFYLRSRWGEGKIHQKLGDSVLSMTLRFREEIAAGRIVARDVRAADGYFADNLEIAAKLRPLHS